MRNRYLILLFAFLLPLMLKAGHPWITKSEKALKPVAKSERLWTGVAVSQDKRIFVNFPNWSEDATTSVAELVNGKALPYPGKQWNSRSGDKAFQAVQSVVVDDANRLWVLDTNNPRFQGVQDPGPVLYQFNLSANKLVKAYNFPQEAYEKASYFNDVRVDTKKEVAYISDSGSGALIVLDMETGKARRLLEKHPSVKAATNYLMCSGHKWENSVDADGIALSPDGQYVYYIALTSHSLYRVPASALNNKALGSDELAALVEHVMAVPATDGMAFDDTGNLWMGGLEDNSINQLGSDGTLYKVAQDASLRWVDSFAEGPDGSMYFTTSQLHLPPEERKAYAVQKLDPDKAGKQPRRKVLIAITSHGTLGENSGDSTGYYLSEVSHAYYVFKDAGFQVDFVSPKGGESPVDGMEMDDPYNEKFLNDEEAQKAVQNAMAADEVQPDEYRAVYYAGGHGTMWDFPENEHLQEISKKVYENGGVVSAVCHGPSGLVNIRLDDGSYLVQGKEVAAFTNEEEQIAKLDDVVPFLLQTKLEKRGATVKTGEPFKQQVVVDGRLVTGQNPASAKKAAEQIIELLKE